jgi:D-alanyl-D-alanine carboxypeptidase
MSRVPIEASRWLRVFVLGLAATFAFTAITFDDADARSRRKRVKYSYVKKTRPIAQPISAGSRYAALVIDAKTRNVLHQAHADSLRHPASLTKIMTLYLLFERLEAGKIKLGTQMLVSEEAAAAAPTKLGVRPGQTLAVEDAIKALVTKSANDAAVVVAEALGGSEEEFARHMTHKARALGMPRTVYRNASGLPDEAQVTTAREQALLGIAIQERFPRYYRYFSTSSFVYHGKAMRNHNKLLGSVAGVDGIKTGYTHASGFNLVSSMRRGDRHVVAVVLGGASGGQRDARMRQLLVAHIMDASTKPVPQVAVAAAQEPPAPAPAKMQVASAISQPAAKPAPAETKTAAPAPSLGSNEPIKPVVVKTVMVKLAPAKTPAAKPVLTPAPAASAEQKPAPDHTAALVPQPAPQPPPAAKPGVLGVLPAAVAAASNAVVTPAAAAERPVVRSGWAIQIGAFEDETEARQRLAAAKVKGGVALKKADSYTERTVRGDKTWYRARFAGFDKDAATAACKALKRDGVDCMALKI